MGIRTQGTELYVVDTITDSDITMVKLTCPTGISGLGGPRDQIESTCLDAIGDKSYMAGLGNPGQVSVPFNLDPTATSHTNLFDMKAAGDVMAWIVCLSEGTTTPTLDTDDTVILPTDRSTIEFNAYVSDVNIDLATNEIVRGTLTLQRSGAVTFTGFTPSS